MSDVGGKENGRDFTRKATGKEDFVRAIAKIAVAQICENEGFQSFQHSALEALADVGVRYMKEVGKTSTHYANQEGRSECNVFDVIQGLEDLNSIQGFPGASDVHHSLASSGTIREISQYVSLVEGVEFVFSPPRFPVSRERIPPPTFLQKGKDPPQHVPAWLPAFPCEDSTTSVGERETDAHTSSSKDQAKEVEAVPNKEEVELMNAQQQELQLKLEQEQEHQRQLEHHRQQQQEDHEQQKQQQQQQQQHQQLAVNNGSEVVLLNPFLAPPFAYGEKAVSSIEPPSRIWEENHLNVMDTYAIPVPETERNEVSEIKETNKHIKLDGRPTVPVRLKFSGARKSLRTCKNVLPQTNGFEKLAVLYERDDENDEKKRRAEQNLKDSMETPLDTTEL